MSSPWPPMKLLTEALFLVARGHSREHPAQDSAGNAVLPRDKTAVSFSMTGAVAGLASNTDDMNYNRALAYLDQAAFDEGKRRGEYWTPVVANESVGRTEALSIMIDAIAMARADEA